MPGRAQHVVGTQKINKMQKCLGLESKTLNHMEVLSLTPLQESRAYCPDCIRTAANVLGNKPRGPDNPPLRSNTQVSNELQVTPARFTKQRHFFLI